MWPPAAADSARVLAPSAEAARCRRARATVSVSRDALVSRDAWSAETLRQSVSREARRSALERRAACTGARQLRTANVPVLVLLFVIVMTVTMVATIVVIIATTVLVVIVIGPVPGLIFGGPHEIHRPVAGVVLVTVLAPVLRMSRRHVQVDRLNRRSTVDHWCRLNHDRLCVHDWRWRLIAEHHLAIHSRHDLAANSRVDADILRARGRHCRPDCQHRQGHQRDRSHIHTSQLTVHHGPVNYANPCESMTHSRT